MWRQYRDIEKGEFFVVGADCAAGGTDYNACQFFSKTKLDVPLVYHAKGLATEMTNAVLPVLERLNDLTGKPPTIAYERANGGLFEMERLATLNRLQKFDVYRMATYGNVTNPESVKLGWDTNTATRPKMLADLKEAIDGQLIRVYDKPTLEECYSFVVVQTSTSWKAQAEQGAHDDLVMALAIAWQLAQMVAEPVALNQGPPPAWASSQAPSWSGQNLETPSWAQKGDAWARRSR